LTAHAGGALAGNGVAVHVETGEPFLTIIRKVLRDGHDMVFKAVERAPKRAGAAF